MKFFNIAGLTALVLAAALVGEQAQATPGDGYCEGERDGKKYSILIGRHASEAHPDDFEEVSIDGQPVARFAASAFRHSTIPYRTGGKDFLVNTRVASTADSEIVLVYPEQEPDAETWNLYLYLEVPGQQIYIDAVEMTCHN